MPLSSSGFLYTGSLDSLVWVATTVVDILYVVKVKEKIEIEKLGNREVFRHAVEDLVLIYQLGDGKNGTRIAASEEIVFEQAGR